MRSGMGHAHVQQCSHSADAAGHHSSQSVTRSQWARLLFTLLLFMLLHTAHAVVSPGGRLPCSACFNTSPQTLQPWSSSKGGGPSHGYASGTRVSHVFTGGIVTWV